MDRPASSTRNRRMLAGSLDQVFSSTSNGLIMYAIAVVSSPASFGAIALVMTALMAVVGTQRGALGTPLLLKANQPTERIHKEGRLALSASLLLGIVTAGSILAAGWSMGSSAVLLAVGAPIVLIQDLLRHVAIADGRANIAATWDGMWFAGSLLLLVTGWATDVAATAVLAGWVLLGLISLLGIAIGLTIRPTLRGIRGWVSAGLGDRVRYGIDAGLDQATVFTVLALTAALLGSSATAALRGATAVLSPAAVLAASFSIVVISESTRASASPARVWRSLLGITFAISGTCVVVGGGLYVLPADVGRLLLGESFLPAREVLPFIVIEYAFASLVFTLSTYLKAFSRSSALLRLKAGGTVATVGSAGLCAYLLGSSAGVAVGLATATITTALVGLALITPWRQRERGTLTASPGDDPAA